MQPTETQQQASTFSGLVMIDGDQVMTDSRTVAKKFKKSHSVVLRAHDNLGCSSEFSRCNYASSDYIDGRGKKQRSITMTKDGFVMLAMSFTGASATAFKEAYICAFNAMAEHIASAEKNLWQKMQELISKEVGSQVKASFGSHLMLDRKKELPSLRMERMELESKIQPSLELA